MTDSTDLVPTNGLPDGRDEQRAFLEQLEAAALSAATPAGANEIRQKAKAVQDALVAMRAPFEDAQRAGKASVLAARRLGIMLAEVPAEPQPRVGVGGSGCAPSERRLFSAELGISATLCQSLVRLARVADPDFQRYIQRPGTIPTLNGALVNCGLRLRARTGYDWQGLRRKMVGAKTPKHPSLDEAYSHIVLAYGHLSGRRGGSPKRQTAISTAMDHLFQAEELLKPYRGGYVD